MLDIDNHCKFHDIGQKNEELAMKIAAQAKDYQPLVEESSPGGFHVWIFWNDWCQTSAAFDLGMTLGGFVIPNKKPITVMYMGAAYRLPGPRSPRWPDRGNKIWDGSKYLDWGADAIDFITSFKGVPPIQAPAQVKVAPVAPVQAPQRANLLAIRKAMATQLDQMPDDLKAMANEYKRMGCRTCRRARQIETAVAQWLA